MRYFNLLNLAMVLIMAIAASAQADDLSEMTDQADWQLLKTQATQAAFTAVQTDADKGNAMPAPQQINFKPFPIMTSLMSPGTQPAINKPVLSFMQPIFIIGSDDLSKAWLKQNSEQLKAAHAIGFLVQAQSQADLDAMKALSNGILLIPASGNIFAQKLKLQHYPVLITKNGIEQ